MTTAQLLPALIVPFIGWRIYTRVRRNVGRQPFHKRRWKSTVIILSIVTALLGWAAMRSLPALGGLAGGLALGVALAVVAFKLTRWESTPTGNFYTPNTAIGLGVTLLFVGRIAYRIVVVVGMTPAERAAAGGMSAYQNPITLLTFGITAGFYIAYNASLLLHAHKKV
jgi:hypothetical protein